jgi:hypothetical protein
MKPDDHPTGRLRFLHDNSAERPFTLQQEFLVWDKSGIHHEWRDVPTVQVEDAVDGR